MKIRIAYLLATILFFSQGHPPEAETWHPQILTPSYRKGIMPLRFLLMDQTARKALNRSDYDLAVTLWSNLYSEFRNEFGANDPRTGAMLQGLAESYYVMGDLDRAEEYFQTVLGMPLGPEIKTQTHHFLALVYRDMELIPKAAEHARNAANLLSANDKELRYKILGQKELLQCIEKSNPAFCRQAETFFRATINLKGNPSFYQKMQNYLNLGLALLHGGNIPQSILALRQALEVVEQSDGLGGIFVQLTQYNLALAYNS